jgi:PAS domain S-box-containing protein
VFLLNVLKEEADSSYNEKTRALAPSIEINKSVAAAFYSGSLFVVLASLEFTTLTHCGMKEALHHMWRKDAGSNQIYWPVFVINLLKLGLTLFALTLWVWTDDPDVLTLCGFGVVLSLTVTRVLNFFFVYQKALIDEAAARVSERFRMSAAVTSRPDDSSAGTPLPQRRPTVDDVTSSGLDNSFDGIILADLNGVISTVNETARLLFGYETKEEIIGKNLSILCGGSDGKRHVGYVKAFKKRLLDDPSSISNNKVLGRQRMLHACRADGTEFPCVIGIKLVSNNKMIA